MPRKRMIDPGIWQSEQIASLTRDQRLLFIGIVSHADDEGRLKGSPFALKIAVFPGDLDVTLDDIRAWRDAIAAARDGHGQAPIRLYSVNGIEYIELPNWKKYQKVEHPSPSLLPQPDEGSALSPDDSPNDQGAFTERSPNDQGTIPPKLRESKLRESDSPPLPPPGGPQGADAPAGAAGRPRKTSSAPKPTGPSLASIADAFRELGLPNPVFIRGEAKAAQDLLRAKFTPMEIARCWQDFATGEYAHDAFSRRDLSFDFLVTRQRITNWRTWDRAGRPPGAHEQNGSSRDGPPPTKRFVDATGIAAGASARV